MPATMPRIVLKATANSAVPGVRSKRIVPELAPASLARKTTIGAEREAEEAADDADQAGLGDELADDPPARSADGALDADLARPLGDAHGHRVDDRQATDDQADDRDADDDRVEDQGGRLPTCWSKSALVIVGTLAGRRLDAVAQRGSRPRRRRDRR